MLARARSFASEMATRRSVRDFAPDDIPDDVVRTAIATAASAPSGANLQPHDGRRIHHYYVNESVGIGCGFLLAALHVAGLTTLTHTPSPMGFLRDILQRPENEKPFLLIPVGYPAAGCRVPDIGKKPPGDVMIWR